MDRTADGHHVVIDGRRWRATDPSIPERLASELRSALMAARRAVGAAQRTGGDAQVQLARACVHDAKLALGERGHPWWEPVDVDAFRLRAAATMRALLSHRGPGRSICPSDVARAIGGVGWRRWMDEVRDVVSERAAAGEVEVTQRGRPVEPPYRGPVRIRTVTSPPTTA